MKRILSFFLVVLLLAFMTACGAKETETAEISLLKLMEANRTETLLEKYDSFSLRMEYEGSEIIYYVDDTLAYFEETPGFYSVTSGEGFYYNEEGNYCRELYAGMEMDNSWYASLAFDPEVTLQEEIVDVQHSDGNIVIHTIMPKDKLEAQGPEADGMESMKVEYRVAGDDYRLLSAVQTNTFADGTTSSITVSAAYNVERLEKAQELYDKLTQTEDVRTVTLVLDPGTPEEASYSVTVPKGGDRVAPIYPEEYGAELYLDAECTQVFDGATDYNTDMTLYLTKK